MEGGASDQTAPVQQGDIVAGKYRVEQILGAGGMGVVVAARHLQLETKVAIKFLLPELVADGDAVLRFAREARAAARIASEHVARVLDVGAIDTGAPYMVMEFLEGGDLAEWLRQRGQLPIEQAVEFVLQACIAVADAHALGIVHRDLKPANLFCVRRTDGQLVIKVLDFGISKVVESRSGPGMSITKTSAMMGSPLYMSPEQIRSPKEVDRQTDLWALGVILFELLAGRPPFSGETIPELAVKIATEAPPTLRVYRPDVPAGLDCAILRCLEKNPRDRYCNVAELAVALLEFAPQRARASVERISGITHAAGGATYDFALASGLQQVSLLPVRRTVTAVAQTTGVRANSKRVTGAIGLLVGLTFAATATVLVVRRQTREGPETRTAGAAAASSPAAPDSSPTTNANPSRESLAPVAVSPTAAVNEAGPGPASLTAASARGARPASHVEHPAVAPVHTASSPPSAAAVPLPNCDPPYYVDPQGARVFKRECVN